MTKVKTTKKEAITLHGIFRITQDPESGVPRIVLEIDERYHPGMQEQLTQLIGVDAIYAYTTLTNHAARWAKGLNKFIKSSIANNVEGVLASINDLKTYSLTRSGKDKTQD